MEFDYKQLTDGEILKLANEKEQLIEDARIALDLELKVRRLTMADAASFHAELKKDELEQRVGALSLLPFWGVGRLFFGMENDVADPASGSEEFDSTLWILGLLFPLIPIGTFRIRRKLQSRGLFWPWKNYSFTVLEQKKRDWWQIVYIWFMAVSCAALVITAMKLLLHVLLRVH